jgi:3'-phosphoadenosine 5'-phosphosulfate sulfotransferase (PAPS reductase)/FAD synthetase
MTTPVRHIMGLSGGKDSTALAVLLHKEIPEMEYFFCDTGKELQETYDYLDKVKARLGIKIEYLSPEKGFDHWLEVYDGYLPSPRSRWCTKQLKIIPLEKFIGDDEAVSYIGIRADENRDGYISTKPTLKPVYPFKERGMVKADIIRLLDDHGLGLPDYYQWRSRSGCFFCFFQRKYEWVMLHENHPDLFAEAVRYEQEHKDGRKYTWTDGETLLELLGRKQEILESHEKSIKRETAKAPNKPLSEVLSGVLDADDDTLPCLMCHL